MNTNKMTQFLNNNKGYIALGTTLMLASVDASAWTTPAVGDTFYDAYDITVNKILKGPVGFIGGLSVIGYGLVAATKSNYGTAIPAIVVGGLLSSVDSLTTSMGITLSVLG